MSSSRVVTRGIESGNLKVKELKATLNKYVLILKKILITFNICSLTLFVRAVAIIETWGKPNFFESKLNK